MMNSKVAASTTTVKKVGRGGAKKEEVGEGIHERGAGLQHCIVCVTTRRDTRFGDFKRFLLFLFFRETLNCSFFLFFNKDENDIKLKMAVNVTHWFSC